MVVTPVAALYAVVTFGIAWPPQDVSIVWVQLAPGEGAQLVALAAEKHPSDPFEVHAT